MFTRERTITTKSTLWSAPWSAVPESCIWKRASPAAYIAHRRVILNRCVVCICIYHIYPMLSSQPQLGEMNVGGEPNTCSSQCKYPLGRVLDVQLSEPLLAGPCGLVRCCVHSRQWCFPWGHSQWFSIWRDTNGPQVRRRDCGDKDCWTSIGSVNTDASVCKQHFTVVASEGEGSFNCFMYS